MDNNQELEPPKGKKQEQPKQDNGHLLEDFERQKKHKNEVKTAFANYIKDVKREHSSLFGTHQLNRYYTLTRQRKANMFQQALQANQQFLNAILEYVNQTDNQVNDPPFQPLPITSANNRSKIKTTVKQCFREWCAQSVEKEDYLKMVKKCQKYLKPKDTVLVPGCGLGRLVFQLVKAGFGAQGNELTYFMLFASNSIINCTEHKQQFKIYPFINSPDYYYDEEHLFRSVLIPEVCPTEVLADVPEQQLNFGIVAGEFTEIYNQRPNYFQGITTCFFLDTANNIFDYVDTIFKTLKKGGIWINFGPLLYHYREIYDQVSIEVSWQVLKSYISDNFQFLEEQIVETEYCHDPKSQMSVVYKCISFVCRKKQEQQEEQEEEEDL